MNSRVTEVVRKKDVGEHKKSLFFSILIFFGLTIFFTYWSEIESSFQTRLYSGELSKFVTSRSQDLTELNIYNIEVKKVSLWLYSPNTSYIITTDNFTITLPRNSEFGKLLLGVKVRFIDSRWVVLLPQSFYKAHKPKPEASLSWLIEEVISIARERI